MQQFLCKGDRRFDPRSMAELASTVRRQKLEDRKKPMSKGQLPAQQNGGIISFVP